MLQTLEAADVPAVVCVNLLDEAAEWGEMEEGVLDISTYYYEANPASVLLDNINAARQTWNYG